MEDVPVKVQASARLRDLGHVVSVRTAQRIRSQALRRLERGNRTEPPLLGVEFVSATWGWAPG
jgi:hypothetical protein